MDDAVIKGTTDYVDFIPTKTGALTLSQVEGMFEVYREKYFDLPLRQAPIISESERYEAVATLSDAEKQNMDNAYYNLEDPILDKRMKGKYEIYENTLLAVRSNVSTVLTGKRKITEASNEINRLYDRVFAVALSEHGKAMGNSEQARKAWMRNRFPALANIKDAYNDFLDEFDIEVERLELFMQATSRALASYQDDAKTQNAQGNYKAHADVYR